MSKGNNRVADNTEQAEKPVIEVAEVKQVGAPGTFPTPNPKKVERLEELFNYLKNSQGFLITVTTISGGKLNHRLLTEEFPELDILKSISQAEKLAVERLKSL